jgi:ABC-type sugar transport system substrate-binding protein
MKKARKLVAFVLACALTAGTALTGCSAQGGASGSASASTAQSAGSSQATSLKKFKVGLSIWSTSDALGKSCSDLVKSSVESLGGEMVVDASGLTPEKQISSVENLISSGCDALTICPFSDSILPKVSQLCTEAKIPFTIYFREIHDANVKKTVESSPYYVGNCCEDETTAGYNIAKSLSDRGCKKVLLISMPRGDTTAENREKGINKCLKETGMQIVSECRDISQASDATKAVESAIAAFPDLDGVLFASFGPAGFSGAIQALKQHNKIGKILLASIDFPDNLQEAFKDNTVAGMCGGHFADPMFTVILLYNRLAGTPLADKPVTLKLNFAYLKSAADADNYYKYFTGSVPVYVGDEVKQMVKFYNKDMTLEKLNQITQSYGVADAMNRHKSLVK